MDPGANFQIFPTTMTPFQSMTTTHPQANSHQSTTPLFKNSPSSQNPLSLSMSLPSGVLFGIMLQKSQMSNPEYIRDQMLMKAPNRMLKTFLSAAGASAFIFAMLELVYNKAAPLETRIVGFNWKRNLLGGALLGIGMNLGGACPGTVLAQIGESIKREDFINLKRALMTLLGGSAGAFWYALQHENVNRMLGNFGEKWTLQDVTGVKQYWKLAIPFSLAMYGCVLGTNFLETWYNTMLYKRGDFNLFELETRKEKCAKATKTGLICGSVIGSLQAPWYIFSGLHLGTSTAYVSLIEPLIHNSYTSTKSLSKNAFQVLSNLGIIIGSYWSASAKKKNLSNKCAESMKQDRANARGFVQTYWRAFTSGALLVFGARMMGGCTSGHGLSGMPLLSMGSFISVASMFGAGIGCGYLEYFLSNKGDRRRDD